MEITFAKMAKLSNSEIQQLHRVTSVGTTTGSTGNRFSDWNENGINR